MVLLVHISQLNDPDFQQSKYLDIFNHVVSTKPLNIFTEICVCDTFEHTRTKHVMYAHRNTHPNIKAKYS